jgi:hypothetical protein
MKMESATWLNACKLVGAARRAVVLRCTQAPGVKNPI